MSHKPSDGSSATEQSTTFPLDSNRVHSIGQGAYPDYSRWEEGQQKTDPAGFSKFVGGIDPISSDAKPIIGFFGSAGSIEPINNDEPFVLPGVLIHKGNTDGGMAEIKTHQLTPSPCCLESAVESLAEKMVEQNHEKLEKISNDFMTSNATQVIIDPDDEPRSPIVEVPVNGAPLVLSPEICQILRSTNANLVGLNDYQVNDVLGHIEHTAREISDFDPAEIDPKSVNIVSRSVVNSNTIICMDDKGYEYREFVNKEGKRVLIQVMIARENDNENDSLIDEHLDYAAEKGSWYENELKKAEEALERGFENHVWSGEKNPLLSKYELYKKDLEPTTIEQLQQGLEFLTRDIEHLKKEGITNFHMQKLRVDLQEVIELKIKNSDFTPVEREAVRKSVIELKKSLQEDIEEQGKNVSEVVNNALKAIKYLDDKITKIEENFAKSLAETTKIIKGGASLLIKEQIELSERKMSLTTKNGFDNVWLDIEKLQKQRRAWKVNFALGTSIVTLIIIIAYIASQNI